MRQFRLAIGILGLVSCFMTIFLYYFHKDTAPGHRLRLIQENEINTDTDKRDSEILNKLFVIKKSVHKSNTILNNDWTPMENVIDTPGCKIPKAIVQYDNKLDKNPAVCQKRAVFLKRNSDETIRIVIKTKILKRYLRKSARFSCCYRFIYNNNYNRLKTPGWTDVESFTGRKKFYKFSPCRKVKDRANITLESDFVNVKCSEHVRRNTTREAYEDVYAFTRKINSHEHISAKNLSLNEEKFNVLMIGMDSMSLPRFTKTMPLTSDYLKENFWLRFQGYHKVGDNTFPNLMAALTGQNVTRLKERCSGNMDICNKDIIWSKFKENGYVTAYGEDNVLLPDIFSNDFAFERAPTDHYMRPLFLIGENNKSNYQPIVCAQKKSSGLHILDYVLDFINTYKEDPFFGAFWINSYSHNENSKPQHADRLFLNYFNKLTDTGVMNKTFVIFFSDHGIRFGQHRLNVESYYDERNPLLHIWVPPLFKNNHVFQHKSLSNNQLRLVTPYDLYNTLLEINQISSFQNSSNYVYSEACSKCHSLFREVSTYRTCEEAAIERKWCSCHKLLPLYSQDKEGMKSVHAVTTFINSMVKSIRTKPCWECVNLKLQSVVRTHYYHDEQNKQLYHVVAFTMRPGNMSFEATLLRSGDKIEIVGTVSSISPYPWKRKCTLHNSKTYQRDRIYCVCQRNQNCH